MTLFELKSKGYTLEECSERMNISLSTVKRIHRRVKEKLKRASFFYDYTRAD